MMAKGPKPGTYKHNMPFCVMYKIYHVERRPSSDLAVEFGCEKSAVLRRMRAIGFPIRHNNETKKGRPPEHFIIRLPADDVISEYRKDYASAASVARIFGVSVGVISRILAENNEPRKPIGLSRNYKKENHPGWNLDKTDDERIKVRNDSSLVLWRNAVFERDRHTCVKCNDSKGGNLNAHHIEPYWKCRDLRIDVSNGATLCEDCHKSFHIKYGWKHFNGSDFMEFMK